MKPQLREKLKEIAKEVMAEDSEYQDFFQKALEKAGKSIPSMSDEEKKAFFNKIDSAWDAKGEKREVNEDVAAELPSASIPMNVKTRLQQAIQQISNSNLSFNQKIQVVAKVVDAMGIDRSELGKIDSKIKSKMTTATEGVKKKIKFEAWDTTTPIKKTGEYAGKTIDQLQSELSALKARSKTYQDKGEAVPEDIKTKEHQLNFAIRAKRNWKGGASNEAITEMGEGDVFYKRIMKLYDKGGEFTKKKVAAAVSHNPNATRNEIIKDLRDMDHDAITKSADKLRIESLIKEDTGKLLKVGELVDLPAKPSYQAKAGTYKLTSIDKNPNGYYMYEFTKNGRTVIFGESELKSILMKESIVNEAVSQSDLNRIKQIVQDHVDAGGTFIGLGDTLKKSFKTDFSTAMGTPMFTIKLGSNIFAILNKKYVDDADFVIGDIAGGTL